MNKAVAWLEEGYDATYEYAMRISRKYDCDVWAVGWCDTEYTSYFRPVQHSDLYNPLFTIKEDI